MEISILKNQLFPIINYLKEPNCEDIIVNSDNSLWIRSSNDEIYSPCGEISSGSTEAIIKTIASFSKKDLTISNSILECEIPHFGERFEGLLPPIVPSPTFAIRKKSKKIFPLESYLERCAISTNQYEVIQEALKEKKTILVSGGTGSGKTSFLNSLLGEFSSSNERFIICEDTKELILPNKASQSLLTTPDVTINDLIRISLRLSPNRLAIGEIRSSDAYSFLKATNTGHPGSLTTIHANSCEMSLQRLNDLCLESGGESYNNLISKSVDLLINMSRSTSGTYVRDMRWIEGFDRKNNQIQIGEEIK